MQEHPERPTPFTPDDKAVEYDRRRKLMQQRLNVLLDKVAKNGPFCNHPNATIHVTVDPANHKHINRRQYPIPTVLMPLVRECIAKWRAQGKVVKAPPNCPFNSPLLVAAKHDKDGHVVGVRVCLDGRQINKYMKEEDAFQIPRIPDVLERFAGCKLFGELDLSEAYFQFRLAVESQLYTAFTLDKEQLMFAAPVYGLKHLPALFERFMCDLFVDMPFVFPYIDNLPFASRNWEEHELHLRLILERLDSVNMAIKASATSFGHSSIRILGHLVDEHGIHVDPAKKQVIQDWPRPKGGAELAAFIGLSTFLSDHIRHFAELTAPLIPLKKQKMIVWDENTTRHFELIKHAIAHAPFLKYPDLNKRFVVACDASNAGIGAVLYQPNDEDDTITPHNIVAITSKKLTPTQQRYPVYKKELWSLVYALRKFHTYLYMRTDNIIYTDHKPLIHILSQSTLSVALQQWLDVILNYNITIKYRPGILHIVPDALSRMYLSAYSKDEDTWGTKSNIQFITPKTNISSPSDKLCTQSITESIKPVGKRTSMISMTGEGEENRVNNESTIDDDKELEEEEELVSHYGSMVNAVVYGQYGQITSRPSAYDAPLSNAPPIEEDNNMNQTDNPAMDIETAYPAGSSSDDSTTQSTLTRDEILALAQEKRGLTLLPSDQRMKIIEKEHAFGHFGVTAIYRKITQAGWWWPGMRQQIAEHIADCSPCQQYSVVRHGYHPTKYIHASLPGDHYIFDLMEMPKASSGEQSCLILVDVFTGFVILRPLQDSVSETIARTLLDIFSIIGIPKILQSDNAPSLVSTIIDRFCKLHGMEHRTAAAYHPQTQGRVERPIQTIRATLNKLLLGARRYWPLFCPFTMLAYNNKINEITHSSPFSLMFGRLMNEFVDYTGVEPQPISLDSWKGIQEQILSLIYPAIELRAKNVRQQYIDRLQRMRGSLMNKELPAGAQVMILDPRWIKNPSARPKTEPQWIGPFVVFRRTLHGPYILRYKNTDAEYTRRIPIDQIKVLHATPYRTTTNNTDEFEIVNILDHRRAETDNEYLVKWKGNFEPSWVKRQDINAPRLIYQYERRLSSRRHPSSVNSLVLYSPSSTTASFI